ncbi:MATE family efflux transporter [Candidatus Fermentibacteria bacterium]|nr:MATE family efflux transporter [Candidatus Fermentibacteria bacterium]
MLPWAVSFILPPFPTSHFTKAVRTPREGDTAMIDHLAANSKNGAHRQRPLAEVWSIAWPTVITMTSHTVMQFVDKLMVGQVGPLEVAAQGNGGIWAFTPIAAFMGFVSVVNTYVSQNYGAGRAGEGPKYAWNAVWLSAAVWAVVLLPMALVLPGIFGRIHGPQQGAEYARLIRMETVYGQILLLGSLLTLMSRALHQFFFGIHRPKIITVSAVLGNIANGFANYALIFGSEGMPKMGLPGIPGVPALGVAGAAVGTVVGTAVELLIPACVFLGPAMNRELRSRSAWRPAVKPIRGLLSIGWPPAVQYGNELVCWSIFMTVLVGRFGPDHMTAGWIALSYMHLSFMPAVGFSVAVTSLVGKYIGAGQPDTAVLRARLGLYLAVGYMTACGIGFVVFRHSLIGAFIGGNVSPERATEIARIGGSLLVCAAVFQMADAVGIIYTGALRGAGDTRWPGIVTMIYSWVFIVAGGLGMIRFLPGLTSIGPWIASAVYIIVLGVTMSRRFEGGNWRSIRLLQHDSSAGPVIPVPPGLEAEETGV